MPDIHSAKFERVKGYYNTGLWTDKMVRNATANPPKRLWITQAQAEEICGKEEGGKNEAQ